MLKQEEWYSEEACPLTEIVSCIGRVYNNRFAVSTFDQSEIAVGIYPLAYLMNHSCVPNASLTFDGLTLQLHAIADIAKGQEVNVRT